ncbi:16S rRNA (uracil(1498)-N(3))-methyltransferase [Geothrix sp. PMB-07]|uniref:16S rRNA (uracil(1498)-N(3))-methyltransferase n=1 Tax=Geothrix sp. PMB-07 TaxID=3068640 RepID=UPI002740E265|nr:16S rRNA (uracil(1498)-N(3))-methyltransferase [Geothrix sp. PMB-07]WLT29979.1 16S rRNA (uracil(1498)-N(3))-methyltransferase [Geothrix sp. PMB-07]
MNLVLLFPEDFIATDRARLSGRRLRHVREVHRAEAGGELTVGMLGGRMGRGRVVRLDEEALELDLRLDQDPPPKLPLTLVIALPRPKVLNRVVAAATSLGAARLVLLNAWKVEKAYWASPKLKPENLREQMLLGLEQAKDTVLPELHLARLFRPFVETDLPALLDSGCGLLAHPGSGETAPRPLATPVTLAIGPEGGWIDPEVRSLLEAGLEPLDLGPRILRTETALAALVGRLF